MEVLQKHGKTMFAIAETEKYAPISYFFNGGKEQKLPNETLVLIPAIALKNYIDFPQMSADGITDAVIHSLKTDPKDFYLINYANADMVGHSGNFPATVKAIEFLDKQLGRLKEEVVDKLDGTLIITADHGNAEDMFDEKTCQPKTSHTNNPVYFLMLNKQLKDLNYKLPQSLKGLSDIAPFILKLMKLPIPKEMD
jgi:2,3-bisphosphoglycerate-independent phosphoglycerate mutase